MASWRRIEPRACRTQHLSFLPIISAGQVGRRVVEMRADLAAKARLAGDAEAAGKILAAPHPGAAKALGRQVRGFDEQRWAQHRFDVVVAGNMAKFGQHPQLRDFLAGTGNRVLVEASPRDRVWGIGLAAGDERAGSPEHWPGLNLLGFALMEVRRRLRAHQCVST
jgi:ribA/ribD-fused uncharacterized protein